MARYLYDRAEYARPWKLVTLAFGIALLIAGALWSGLPDWDVPVSFLMALCAYLTAAPSMRALLERRLAHAHYAAFWTWFTVDGSYYIYWTFVNPDALDFRSANAGVSLALYGMCGLLWYPKASLREIRRSVVKSAA
jgi:hypothetical protein